MSPDVAFCIAFFVIQLGFSIVTIVLSKPGTSRRLVCVVYVIALQYPLGEMLQEFHDVPEFIRWHLSDFGYVPYQALSVYTTYTIYRLARHRENISMADYFANTKIVSIHTALVGIILIAVTGYEVVVDSTDVIDILAYYAGAFIVLATYKKLGEYLKNIDIPSMTVAAPSIAR